MIEKEYKVTGLTIKATYTDNEVNSIFLPILKKLVKMREEKNERIVLYLAAPPGAGKTTLSLFLEDLHKEYRFPFTFQSVSMDGFHHSNHYLNRHFIQKEGEEILLRKCKGIPETFHFDSLKQKIKELTEKESVDWPTYDRLLHDVSEQTIKVDADIVLIEGNYLLLNKEPWRALIKYSDYSIFVDAELETLKARLIERKQRGGTTFEEAADHYNQTDKVNAELVLSQSMIADQMLYLTKEEHLEKK